MNKREKIGIVGLGFVGGAVRHWFENERREDSELFVFDKYKNEGSPEEINRAEIIFIAVPTPYKEGSGYDDSAIEETLNTLKEPKIVVIKSTVLPGSTEKFQNKFSKHKILFNPEFLVAKTAVQDFLFPSRQIVGYTEKSKDQAERVLNILPTAPYSRIMPATEAEMVKYFGNTFLPMKVVFANQLYDICKRIGIDYEIVKEAGSMDERIGKSHLEIFHDGYRGYRGACFPKDVKALIDFSEKMGAPFELLKMVDRINEELVTDRREDS